MRCTATLDADGTTSIGPVLQMQTLRHGYETSPESSREVVVELQAELEPSLLEAK